MPPSKVAPVANREPLLHNTHRPKPKPNARLSAPAPNFHDTARGDVDTVPSNEFHSRTDDWAIAMINCYLSLGSRNNLHAVEDLNILPKKADHKLCESISAHKRP